MVVGSQVGAAGGWEVTGSSSPEVITVRCCVYKDWVNTVITEIYVVLGAAEKRSAGSISGYPVAIAAIWGVGRDQGRMEGVSWVGRNHNEKIMADFEVIAIYRGLWCVISAVSGSFRHSPSGLGRRWMEHHLLSSRCYCMPACMWVHVVHSHTDPAGPVTRPVLLSSLAADLVAGC